MRRSGGKIMLQLIGLIRPLLHVMAGAIILGIAGYLCAILIPVFGAFGVVSVLGTDISVSLTAMVVCVLLFAVFRGIFRYTEQAGNHYIAFKLLALIRHKVFEALRNLAPAKLEGKEKGNLISIITSDIELLEVFYAHTISPIVIGFVTSLIMVIYLSNHHWLIGMIALTGYAVVGIAIPMWIGALGKKDGMVYRNEFGDLNSFFLDSLRGLRESIQYDTGDKRLQEILDKTDSLDRIQKRLKEDEGKTKAATSAVIVICGLAVLAASVALQQQGVIKFESILICTTAMLSSFGPVVALSNLSNNLTHTLASGERVLTLLEEEPIIEEVAGMEPIYLAELECKNVGFAYEEEQILSDFSMKIDQNKIVGIHGKSGSGKSTLLKLFMRFWDAQKGAVEVSGKEVRQVNTSDLRNMEGYMTQDTFLFHSTIRENISIAKPDASLDEIIEASKKASVHTYIASLPNGYDTKVSELGESLSGGERQRIGLARAFLHDAPILLLDEPTSNLDSLNESIILKSLRETCKNKTVVLVSHRKSTMHIADSIFRMETGRLS